MGVATRVTEWLRRAGHDVRHLRDEGLYRLPDGDVFRKAAAEQRVILTFDMDFGELFALSGERQASVILFRLHNTRSDHLVERLSIVLRESSLGPWSRGRSSWSRNRGTAFAGCQAADRNPATQSPVSRDGCTPAVGARITWFEAQKHVWWLYKRTAGFHRRKL
jgi:predicted nuclease of predicted toxin-antitoxin system